MKKEWSVVEIAETGELGQSEKRLCGLLVRAEVRSASSRGKLSI